MKRVAVQDAKASFGKLVDEAAETSTVITRNGMREAVLIPIKPEKGAKIVQGKRGAMNLLEALRSAPYPVPFKRIQGRFRPVKL
ncbi:MAG: type II toxin-antitoxin system Phd/YefM family antitoxin [Alphaproteobacteria bacterium]|nr:type II toxin-antitoxin system Phd/YefM family antitoxin [Alphaproteobacteria bacterium]